MIRDSSPLVSGGMGLVKAQSPPARMVLFLKTGLCGQRAWLVVESLPSTFEILWSTSVTETDTYKKLEWNMNIS